MKGKPCAFCGKACHFAVTMFHCCDPKNHPHLDTLTQVDFHKKCVAENVPFTVPCAECGKPLDVREVQWEDELY